MNKFKKEFTTEELVQWINLQVHFGENYSKLFVVHHLDGESFLKSNLSSLKEIGVSILGHRLRLFGLIRKERKILGLSKK